MTKIRTSAPWNERLSADSRSSRQWLESAGEVLLVMESTISNQERSAFRERLVQALASIGCAPTATTLAREFNARADGAAVTAHGARKWLKGEAFPTHERLSILARWLNVSPQWLRFGEAPMRENTSANDETLIPHYELVLLDDFRRLDPRSQEVVRDLVRSLLSHHSMRT